MIDKPITAVLLSLALLAGCTWVPHQVQLTAAPPPAANRVGAGVSVHVAIIDDRGRRTVGQRGVGAIGSDITAPAVMDYLTRQVTQGFQDRGFALVSRTEAETIVTVSLRSFRWDMSLGFFTGGEEVYVSVKAEGRRMATQEERTRTYQYDHETRAIFVAHGTEISEKMDAGLSAVLADLFSDEPFLRFLAGR